MYLKRCVGLGALHVSGGGPAVDSAAGVEHETARAALAEQFLPLARSIARRYADSGEPLEDLVQVASVGLLHAIDRFDPGRDVSFSSFAVPTILGELKRHFRDRTWAVHVPRSLNELSLRVDALTKRQTQATGHSPTVTEIGSALGVADEAVLEALEVGRARRLSSLDSTVATTGDTTLTVGETIASPRAQREAEQRDAQLLAGPMLRTLAPRDELVVRLRYERDLNQLEIGEIIGVSQMQVSRILRRCLDHLHALGTAGQPADVECVSVSVAA